MMALCFVTILHLHLYLAKVVSRWYRFEHYIVCVMFLRCYRDDCTLRCSRARVNMSLLVMSSTLQAEG